jgi:hypothetical protein
MNPRDLGDQMIERTLPPERAGDDLRGERTVAFVGEMLAAVRQRGWKIGLIPRDRA